MLRNKPHPCEQGRCAEPALCTKGKTMAIRLRSIPPGAKCLSPKQTYTKFGRKKTWLWDRLKSDPTFPRPVYLGPRSPVFLEHELDAWLDRQSEKNK